MLMVYLITVYKLLPSPCLGCPLTIDTALELKDISRHRFLKFSECLLPVDTPGNFLLMCYIHGLIV